MSLHASIVQAINERRLVLLNYDPGLRVIEPCAYGASSEHHGLLRAYQRSGASAHGEPENWKLFRTDRISSIQLLDERFAGPRPEYRRNDKAMRGGMICQL